MKRGRRSLFLGHKKNEEKIEEDTKNLKESERKKELFFSCLVKFWYKKEGEIENKKTKKISETKSWFFQKKKNQ